MQGVFLGNTFFGSEDCLFLNIFVPAECSEMNSDRKLTTMLYTYGGQYEFGSSSDYGPDFLMETDVIFVSAMK